MQVGLKEALLKHASVDDEILAELFKILKDGAVKVMH